MKEFNKKSIIMLVISIAVGAVIANIPPFEGLTATSMTYLGIFVGMLIMLIANALPSWATCLGAMALMVAFQVGSLAEVFSAFGGSIVWLMIAVFAFATGIENSGLLTRLALKMLTIFPKNYRGQVLSLMTAGLVVSPLIPSNNAKTNLLAPMATEMTKQVGYEKRSKPALGLLTAVFMPPYIGSHAFLTGSANVAFMLGVVGLSFSWVGYLSLTWVWLILLLLGTYIFCMTYCRPKEKLNLPENYFSDKYQALGKMKKEEWVALVVVVACLALWISNIFDAGMVALLGAVAMSAFGILTPKDFQTRIPWGLIMFIGALIGIAGFMSTTGVSTWLAGLLGPSVSPVVSSVWIFVPVLLVLTWILRAFIPAQGVCIVILYSIFGPLLPDAGISLFIFGFVEYIGGNIWFNGFMNPFVLGALGVAGNEYVTIKEFKKSAYAYAVISIVAMMGSIPLWMAMGLC